MRETSGKERTRGDVREAISPELALVDPDLRSAAIAELPRPETVAFLRLAPAPRTAPAAERAEGFAAVQVARPHVSLPVAAAAYAVAAIIRVALFDLSVALALAMLIVTLILLR
jgi:hypothetical protein